MQDDPQLEQAVQDIIIDICEVMYRRGYASVPVGAVMRLVGVGEDRARAHDDEWLALDKEFATMLEDYRGRMANKKNIKKSRTKTPPGATLH